MPPKTPFMDMTRVLDSFNSKSIPVGFLAAKMGLNEAETNKMLDTLEQRGMDLFRKDGHVALVKRAC